MNLLIAPDKFKGTMSALEVAMAIKEGVNKLHKLSCIVHPMADGGDGSLEVLRNFLNLERIDCTVKDPLGRPVETYYYSSGSSAYIELAVATGLALLEPDEMNPMYTSTFGTGEQILHALNAGHLEIYLFLGGSSTNDCGIGIANALGIRFLDENSNELLPVGKNLINIRSIDTGNYKYSKAEFHIVCDVNNPLYGIKGAAMVYARQKGANDEEIKILNDGLKNIARILFESTGIEVNEIPGAGAAGGIGAGLTALLGAKMLSGFKFMSDKTSLENAVKNADVVVSGEGKIDESSLYGKVINGISGYCKKYKKPLYLFCGINEISPDKEKQFDVRRIYSIMDIAENLDEAMSNSSFLLSQLATRFATDLEKEEIPENQDW